MTIGERIEERRKALGIASQSELARRAEMRQSTLNGLIRKPYRWSPYLVQIAKALDTTVEYLTGDTNDPATDAPAPLPAPRYQAVTLQVLLPGERALARMFEGLLRSMDLTASVDEQALLLAKRLPIGLSQLRDLLPDAGPADRPAAERLEDFATSVLGPRQ
jgi:transcriptional regulator with XRE-family HTH domain